MDPWDGGSMGEFGKEKGRVEFFLEEIGEPGAPSAAQPEDYTDMGVSGSSYPSPTLSVQLPSSLPHFGSATTSSFPRRQELYTL